MPLTDEDKKKYKALYLQSAKPYVDQLESIATLQSDDVATAEIIHRAAHSMGSQSLMMDYNSMAQLSRLIERIFKAKLDESYEVTEEVKNLLVKAVSRMQDSLKAIEIEDKELDLTQEIQELQTISKVTV